MALVGETIRIRSFVDVVWLHMEVNINMKTLWQDVLNEEFETYENWSWTKS